MTRLLPQDIEAECGVLGSIILDPEAIRQVADFLQPEDFYRDAHRRIYEVILHLYRSREPADFITICHELEQRNQLKEVGGASSITSLINQVPTSGNVEYYGHIVERTALRRRLIHTAGQIAARAYEEGDAYESLRGSEALLRSLTLRRRRGGAEALGELLPLYMQRLETLSNHGAQGTITGIPSGFPSLDQLTGGWQPSDLIVLAARPGRGKTAAALIMLAQLWLTGDEHGARSLLFSMEMSKWQILQRLMAMASGIDQMRLRIANLHPDRGEWERLVEAADLYANRLIWIDDTPALDVEDLCDRARRHQAEFGLDILYVDYTQLMHAKRADGKSQENRVAEVTQITGGLKALARELNIPVIALAQLSRAVEQRQNKVPQLSDLRESGSFEHDSDIVLFLHKEQDIAPIDGERSYPVDLILAKHRNGPADIAVPLVFRSPTTRFEELTPAMLTGD